MLQWLYIQCSTTVVHFNKVFALSLSRHCSVLLASENFTSEANWQNHTKPSDLDRDSRLLWGKTNFLGSKQNSPNWIIGENKWMARSRLLRIWELYFRNRGDRYFIHVPRRATASLGYPKIYRVCGLIRYLRFNIKLFWRFKVQPQNEIPDSNTI